MASFYHEDIDEAKPKFSRSTERFLAAFRGGTYTLDNGSDDLEPRFYDGYKFGDEKHKKSDIKKHTECTKLGHHTFRHPTDSNSLLAQCDQMMSWTLTATIDNPNILNGLFVSDDRKFKATHQFSVRIIL